MNTSNSRSQPSRWPTIPLLAVSASCALELWVRGVWQGARRRAPWHDLAPYDRSGVRRVNSVVLADGGKAYAYSYTRQVSDLYSVTGLR